MAEPCNIARDKQIAPDKEAEGDQIVPGEHETLQPGRKPRMEHHASDESAGDEGIDEPSSTD